MMPQDRTAPPVKTGWRLIEPEFSRPYWTIEARLPDGTLASLEIDDERIARLIAAAPEKAALCEELAHVLTVIAEACDENWHDWTSNGFDVGDVAPFLRETAQHARSGLAKAGRAPQ